MLKRVASELTKLPGLVDFFSGLIPKPSSSQLVYGADGSLRSMLMAAVRLRTGFPMLVIAADQNRAGKLLDDLVAVFGEEEVFYFPAHDLLYFYNVLSLSPEISRQRIDVLWRLALGQNIIVVTTAQALQSRLMPPERFRDFFITIEQNRECNIDQLTDRLIEGGYERVPMVEQPGQISVRGGILDIFPVSEGFPCRIEFFGDTVESIRRFNPETQRSMSKVRILRIPPAREMVVGNRERKSAMQSLEEELEKYLKAGRGKSFKKTLKEKTEEHIEEIAQGAYFPGIDQYLPHFYPEEVSLFHYLPENTLLLVDDLPRCEQAARQQSVERRETQSTLLAQGEILPTQVNLSLDFSLLLAQARQPLISFALFTHSQTVRPYNRMYSLAAKPVHGFHGRWELFAEEVEHWRDQDYRIVILASSRERAKGMAEMLAEKNIPAAFSLPKDELPPRSVALVTGSLESGFVLPEIKLALVTEQEVLPQKKKKRRVRGKEGLRIADYQELQVGDLVVHEQHGIGQYLGIRTLEVGGINRDYLYIQYAGNDKLYIPVEQIDAVRKYIGVEGKRSKLNSLGGNEWNRVKARVQASVQELAKELLALYAHRETTSGFAFPKDHPWQKEFEDAFPYEETPDQLRAVEEIKADMERDRPMDRLLCGDVGYGKTEVALRAAFKAVMAQKQVAFLVPTTVLAQQYYRNFLERFDGFPVRVEVLSRFQGRAEQKAILTDLAEGKVDIIIGTHRLLSQDVRFFDLGLLIIDEEQRFGVRHKERIKLMKKNVDVMSMTATPIPRTLHMSLVGVRDMSVIETPPEDRFPVQTYVLEYSEMLIREAILREVNRGGQVYFVYNRVQTIDKMAADLNRIVPEVRLAVAHGQMAEDKLEKVMVDFLNGEYDVLLSTTIVEAGLDIPNVNTIIIYDADKFGLSQLYQLRGRVGRSSRIAYCYLTYQKDKVLTEMAEKRLQAIKEFTELGSGLKIALRDLEIRGAGNILGPEQHGFMMAVGFDLYVKLLEEAVNLYKGKETEKAPMPRVEINLDAYLPSTYISDTRQKIVFYQRIADIDSPESVEAVREELEDRYGTMPEAAENLLKVAELKLKAAELGVVAISEEKGHLLVRFHQTRHPDSGLLLAVSRKYQCKLTMAAGKQLVLTCRQPNTSNKADYLLELFNELDGLVKKNESQL